MKIFDILSIGLLFIVVFIPAFKLASYWLTDEDYKDEIKHFDLWNYFSTKTMDCLAFALICSIATIYTACTLLPIYFSSDFWRVMWVIFSLSSFYVVRKILIIILERITYG